MEEDFFAPDPEGATFSERVAATEAPKVEAFKTAVHEPVVSKSESEPRVTRIEKTREVTPKVANEPPASIYGEVRGKPLVSEYLSMKQLYGTFNTKEQAKEVESFVTEQIQKNHLIDNRKSYYQVVEDMEKALHLTPQHDPFYRLEKMSKYIRVLKQTNSVADKRRRLMREM